MFKPANTTGGKVFTIICTHWDDQSDPQRQLAASLILYRGAYEAETTCGPVFVLGDFNSPSSGPDCGGYEIMTGVKEPLAIPEDFRERYALPGQGNRSTAATAAAGNNSTAASGNYSTTASPAANKSWCFEDVAAATEPLNRSGHHATFTGFYGHTHMELKRIDFVMAGGRGWRGGRYRVGENWWDQGRLASDHRPVWADVSVE
jgi:endonuclease/exonuclease/phosphatase family metal-dependent hydrolase